MDRKEHILNIEKKFKYELIQCFLDSVIYTNFSHFKDKTKEKHCPDIQVLDNVGSIESIPYGTGKIALLVFADPYLCGGLYFQGATTQEEKICDETTLYNILFRFKRLGYYNLNKCICATDPVDYNKNCIYIPNVRVLSTNQKINIIHCAAPNAETRLNTSVEMANQIALIHNVACENDINTLILGMFGCGAFENDPKMVGNIFKEEFKTSPIDKVIFPIYESDEYKKNEFLKGLL